jgi:hypothetical protein
MSNRQGESYESFRVDVEQSHRVSEVTIAYYDRMAEAYWDGTRDHDVSQNYTAFLDAIENDPPYSILDLGWREQPEAACGAASSRCGLAFGVNVSVHGAAGVSYAGATSIGLRSWGFGPALAIRASPPVAATVRRRAAIVV